jgi:hypothetical protein
MMKWQYEMPKLGYFRERRVFALLPTKLEDGHVVWLESYWRTEVFAETRLGNRWCYLSSQTEPRAEAARYRSERTAKL